MWYILTQIPPQITQSLKAGDSMKRQNKKIWLTAIACIGLVAVGTVLAYLTDGETQVNVLSIGNVNIAIEEEEYDKPENSKARENMVQNQMLAKDPKVKNTGSNDAIVFLKVTVPVRNVMTAGTNGEKLPAAWQEVFTMLTNEENNHTVNYGSQPEHPHEFNLASENAVGWRYLEIADTELIDNETGDKNSETNTYFFAYNAKLAPNAETGTLFNYVKYKPVLEGQLTGKSLNIILSADAIQAEYIEIDGMKSLASYDYQTVLSDEQLKEIYDVYLNNRS